MLTKFSELDRLVNFQEKAGFQLAKLQVDDIEQAVKLPVFGFFYEVGGGKTVVSTAAAFMHNPDVCIISVRPILIPGWKRWLAQFGNPLLVWKGAKSIRKGEDLTKHQFVLTSHQSFAKDVTFFKQAVTGKNAVIIVDEAHDFTNTESKRFKALEALMSTPSRTFKEKRVIFLTGTPANKPDDPYAFIRLGVPEAYCGYEHFKSMHITEYDFFGNPKRWENLERVRKVLGLMSVTRTKEEIHGYNNKPTIVRLPYELSAKHKQLYDKFREERLLIYGDEKLDGTNPNKFRHLLNRAIPSMDLLSMKPTDNFSASAWELVEQVVDEVGCRDVSKSKLIIWTVYQTTTERALQFCTDKLKIRAVAAYGGGNSPKAVEAFLNDPAIRIGVMQYQSAGAGFNPQGVCWAALFLDPNSNPIDIKQAIGRLDRVGQKHKPTMWFAEAVDTVQGIIWDKLSVNARQVEKVEVNPIKLETLLNN